MSSVWGVKGPPVRAASPERVLAPLDLYPEKRTEFYPCTNYAPTPTYTTYTPKPGGGCNRLTSIESRGSYTSTIPLAPYDVIFIFVQGKKSACIVARDLGKDKDKDKKIFTLKMNFYGLADPRLGEAAITREKIEQPPEMYPCAFVCTLSNADGVDEKKRSQPSSHKESSSRPLNEKAALDFLRQKMQNDDFEETIQTAISALQCLYQENVKADEIEMYTAHVDTAHLDSTKKFLSRGEIEEHLAAPST